MGEALKTSPQPMRGGTQDLSPDREALKTSPQTERHSRPLAKCQPSAGLAYKCRVGPSLFWLYH